MIESVRRFLTQERSKNFNQFALLLIALEIILNWVIINYVPYTEIDWKAYMEQVSDVDQGIYNYTKLEGGTGPLVYPGAHVLIYYVLFHATQNGQNVFLAQHIFMGLYMVMICVLLMIYKNATKVPLWALLLLSASRRIHSIFVLRLFNDCWAIFFLYVSIYCFIKDRWSIGCFFYSFAVGIKMNVFLYAPGLFILLLMRFGLPKLMPKLAICAILQVVIALPFISVDLIGYLRRAFNLGRVFIYYWSVNWKFIPEDLFLNPTWGLALLVGTIILWLVFARSRWLRAFITLSRIVQHNGEKNLTADYILTVLFTSNFIGVYLSRTLHYQFYVWYYHTLPFLLWTTPLPNLARVIIWFFIELVWNIFPSNFYTSLLLFLSHTVIIISLWFGQSKLYPTRINKK